MLPDTIYFIEKLLWCLFGFVSLCGVLVAYIFNGYVKRTDRKLDSMCKESKCERKEIKEQFEIEKEKRESCFELLRRDNKEAYNIIFRQLDKKADKK